MGNGINFTLVSFDYGIMVDGQIIECPDRKSAEALRRAIKPLVPGKLQPLLMSRKVETTRHDWKAI